MTNDREELIVSLRRAEISEATEARASRAELAAASADLADAQKRIQAAGVRLNRAISGSAVHKARAALEKATTGYLDLRSALAARESFFIGEANRLIGHGRQVAETQRQEVARAIVSLPAILLTDDYEAQLDSIREQFQLPAPAEAEQEIAHVG